jgi:hypothetical protein
MNRWFGKLLMYLPLGAMTAIIIEWACAAWVDPNLARPDFRIIVAEDQRREAVSTQTRFGHTRINRMTLLGGSIDETGRPAEIDTQFDDHARSESRAGWPCRALVCSTRRQVTVRRINGHNQAWDPTAKINGALVELGTWPNIAGSATWRAVPYHPLWVGLIVDSLFYGLIWFGLIQGIAVLRRRRRRIRGLCPRCAYDLRGRAPDQTVCPECGARSV